MHLSYLSGLLLRYDSHFCWREAPVIIFLVVVPVSISIGVGLVLLLLLFLYRSRAVVRVLSLLCGHLLSLVLFSRVFLRCSLDAILRQSSRLVRETSMLLLNALEHFIQTLLLHASTASSTAATASSCGAWGSTTSNTAATSSASSCYLILRLLSHFVLVVCSRGHGI